MVFNESGFIPPTWNDGMSPAGFPKTFENIYTTVEDTVKGKVKSTAPQKKSK
jgi:hypothetical protein